MRHPAAHVEAAGVAPGRLVGVVPARPRRPDAARRGVGGDDVARGDHGVGAGVAGHHDAVLGLDPHHPAHGHDSTILTACAELPQDVPLLALASLAQTCARRPWSLDIDGIHEARRRAPPHPARRARDRGVDRGVGITYGTAPARDDHEIPLRIYRPRDLPDSRTDVPVVMWFHGGGWVLGDVVGDDPVCTHVAAEVGCVVVSVDYRTAPEHRAPTAAHDCVDATTWVRASGDCGPTPRGWRSSATPRAATSRRSSRRCCRTTASGCGSGPGLPLDGPDAVLPLRAGAPPRRPAHPATWRSSASTTRPRAPTCATRCCRRSSAGSRTCPGRWCRRPTSTRSGTTASGMPPRCAGRACRCGSRTTWGSRTASPGCGLTPAARQQRWELVAELAAALAPAARGWAVMREVVVFSGSAHRALAHRICDGLGVGLSETLISRFSNDCLQAQLLANCRQRDVYIVQPLVPPTQDSLMELLLMIDAARGASAAMITAVIPHFAYAQRQEGRLPHLAQGASRRRTSSPRPAPTGC